jgi:hypothetical protein
MTKLLFTLGVIAAGLGFGYGLQRLAVSGRIRLPIPLANLRRLLQKIGLLFFMALSFMGAVWIIRVESLKIAALPLLGAFILLAGGGLAVVAARVLGLDRKQTGSFFACGSFSNIGSIGALAVFMFLGERGFALMALYKLFEEVVYFTIGFPIAKYYSAAAGESAPGGPGNRLKAVFSDPFVLAALAAIAAGGALNLSGVERPELFKTMNALFVPAGTFVLLTSIGLAMRFSSAGDYVRECAAMCGIKFLALPAAACLAGYLLGFAEMDSGLPLKVVLVVSAMPVAFTALIPPSIYDLDLDLSNACWLTTTLALALVLPILYLIVR